MNKNFIKDFERDEKCIQSGSRRQKLQGWAEWVS